MSERIEPAMSDISEMVAGDGGGLSMPPAFVFVNLDSIVAIKRTTKIRLMGAHLVPVL